MKKSFADMWCVCDYLNEQENKGNLVLSLYDPKRDVWKVVHAVDGVGYLFADETQSFYPEIFDTYEQCLEAREKYIKYLLGA